MTACSSAGSDCFPEGTPVLTRKGYTPIEKIVIGMEAFSHKGRWCKILHVTSRLYTKDVLQICTVFGRDVLATPAHAFWVQPRPSVAPIWMSCCKFSQHCELQLRTFKNHWTGKPERDWEKLRWARKLPYEGFVHNLVTEDRSFVVNGFLVQNNG
jgi:hypothetical protein